MGRSRQDIKATPRIPRPLEHLGLLGEQTLQRQCWIRWTGFGLIHVHHDQGRLKRSSLPSWRLSELKLVSPDLCELKPPVSSGSPASCLILLRLLSAPRRSWLHRVSQHCKTPVPAWVLVLSQQKHLTPRCIMGCAEHQEMILRCLGFPCLRWGVNW